MSSTIHKLLNTVLPFAARNRLRASALAMIPTMRHLDMPSRMRTLAANGFDPAVILDIGAANGEWSRGAAKIWPRARFFGFEPNRRERDALEKTKRDLRVFDYKLCFLGADRGQVSYQDAGTQTSVLAGGAGQSVAEMHRLDDLIDAGEVPAPSFMKLDVQGFELQVLRGAERALRGCEAAMLEVSFIPFFENMPLVADVVEFMGQRGFAWYDVTGIFRRAGDDALLQMDVMFLRNEHPLRRGGLA